MVLTDEDERRVRFIFATWDANGDGRWDVAEARQMQRDTDGTDLDAEEWHTLCAYATGTPVGDGDAPAILEFPHVRRMYVESSDYGTDLSRDYAAALDAARRADLREAGGGGSAAATSTTTITTPAPASAAVTATASPSGTASLAAPVDGCLSHSGIIEDHCPLGSGSFASFAKRLGELGNKMMVDAAEVESKVTTTGSVGHLDAVHDLSFIDMHSGSVRVALALHSAELMAEVGGGGWVPVTDVTYAPSEGAVRLNNDATVYKLPYDVGTPQIQEFERGLIALLRAAKNTPPVRHNLPLGAPSREALEHVQNRLVSFESTLHELDRRLIKPQASNFGGPRAAQTRDGSMPESPYTASALDTFSHLVASPGWQDSVVHRAGSRPSSQAELRRLQDETNSIIHSTSSLLKSIGGNPPPVRAQAGGAGAILRASPVGQTTPGVAKNIATPVRWVDDAEFAHDDDDDVAAAATNAVGGRWGSMRTLLAKAVRHAARLRWGGGMSFWSVRLSEAVASGAEGAFLETPANPVRFATLAPMELQVLPTPTPKAAGLLDDGRARCVFLLSSDAAVATSVLKAGLLPLSPPAHHLRALLAAGALRCVAGVGYLVAGGSIADVFDRAHALQRACEQQLVALAAVGGDIEGLRIPQWDVGEASAYAATGFEQVFINLV